MSYVSSLAAPVSLTGTKVSYDEFRESQKIIDGTIDGAAGWANAGNPAATNTAIISPNSKDHPKMN